MKLKPNESLPLRFYITIFGMAIYLIGMIITLLADWREPSEIYIGFFSWLLGPISILAWIDVVLSMIKQGAECFPVKTKDIRFNPFTRILVFILLSIVSSFLTRFRRVIFIGEFFKMGFFSEISIGIIEIISIIGRIRLHFQLKEEREEQERIEREKEEAMLNKMKQKTSRRKPRKTRVVKKPYFDDAFDDDFDDDFDEDFDDSLPSNWSVTIE